MAVEPVRGELSGSGAADAAAAGLFFTAEGPRPSCRAAEAVLRSAFANRFDRIGPREIEAVEILQRKAGSRLPRWLRPCRRSVKPPTGWAALLASCRSDDFSLRLTQAAAAGDALRLPSPFSDGPASCRESYLLGSGMNCLRFSDGTDSFFLMQRISCADAIYVPGSHLAMELGYFHERYVDELLQHWIADFRAILAYARGHNSFGGIIASQARPAHFFYETLPDLTRIIERPELSARLPRIILRANHDFVDLDILSPTTRHETLDHAAIESLSHTDHSWLLQIGTHRYFRPRDFSYEACDQLFLKRTLASCAGHAERLTTPLAGCRPLVWVGVESQKRCWLEQEEGLAHILHRLAERFPGLGVVIDGWTLPLTPARNNWHQAENDRQLVKRLTRRLQPEIRWISLVGETCHTKLAVGRNIDFCLCSFSTASLYVSRILGKPGFFHLSRQEAIRFLSGNIQKHGHRHAVLLPLHLIRDQPPDGPPSAAPSLWGRILRGMRHGPAQQPRPGPRKIVPLGYSIDPEAFWSFIEPRLPRLLEPPPDRLRLFIEPPCTVPAALRRSIRMAVHGNLLDITATRGPTGRLEELADRSPFFLANQLLYGLFAYGAHHSLPLPGDHLIWLGDPRRRVRRQARMIARREQARGGPARRPVEVMRSSRRRMLDNPFTRLVSGHPEVAFGACHEGLLEQAIDHLDRHFVFIGIAERLADSIRRLCRLMDWDESLFGAEFLPAEPSLPQGGKPRDMEWSGEEAAAAEPLIHLDRRLLEAAMTRIEARDPGGSTEGSA